MLGAGNGRTLRRRRARGRTCALLVVALGALALDAPAAADPTVPLGHHGRWITDATGRVVILHGVNMVYKRTPYLPSSAGFGADDAAFLAEHGFNTVRLGLIYKAVGSLLPGPTTRAT